MCDACNEDFAVETWGRDALRSLDHHRKERKMPYYEITFERRFTTTIVIEVDDEEEAHLFVENLEPPPKPLWQEHHTEVIGVEEIDPPARP